MSIRPAALTRRAALLALAGGLATGRALADEPPGLVARAEILPLLDGMMRVDDGDPSGPRVRVLFTPGCHRSLEMFEACRPHRMAASWRWIPYGGDPLSQRTCAAALRDGSVAALEACMRGDLAPGPDAGGMVAQDHAIDMRAGRMLWEATSTALGTPTTVYARRSGVAYAVRGGMKPDRLAAMLAAAA